MHSPHGLKCVRHLFTRHAVFPFTLCRGCFIAKICRVPLKLKSLYAAIHWGYRHKKTADFPTVSKCSGNPGMTNQVWFHHILVVMLWGSNVVAYLHIRWRHWKWGKGPDLHNYCIRKRERRKLTNSKSLKMISFIHVTLDKGFFFSTKKYVPVHFSNSLTKTCCGYSLEVPHWGTSNEYSQHTFSLWHKKLFTWYPLLSRPVFAFFYKNFTLDAYKKCLISCFDKYWLPVYSFLIPQRLY